MTAAQPWPRPRKHVRDRDLDTPAPPFRLLVLSGSQPPRWLTVAMPTGASRGEGIATAWRQLGYTAKVIKVGSEEEGSRTGRTRREGAGGR